MAPIVAPGFVLWPFPTFEWLVGPTYTSDVPLNPVGFYWFYHQVTGGHTYRLTILQLGDPAEGSWFDYSGTIPEFIGSFDGPAVLTRTATATGVFNFFVFGDPAHTCPVLLRIEDIT